MSISSVSSSATAATSAAHTAKPVARDSDGDNDGSRSLAAQIGPAVILSLSKAAPDAAAGDPDHDGK